MKKKILCGLIAATLLLQSVYPTASTYNIRYASANSVPASAGSIDISADTASTADTEEADYSTATDNMPVATKAAAPTTKTPANSLSLKGSSKSTSKYTGLTYTHADAFDGKNIYNGIDVSKYNGSINWTKVKNDGIDFAIIRAGYRGYGVSGTLCKDTTFKTNIEGALNAGIKVGVYFFTEAINTTEAKEEAEFCLDLIKDYNVTFPVVIDYEFPTDSTGKIGRMYNANLSKSAATKNVKSFCDTVKSAGYTPMVYANINDFTNLIDGAALSKSYKIWLARYNTVANYSNTYEYWQYSSKGSVNGISGNVDCNFWYTDSKLADSSSTTKPTVAPTETPTEAPKDTATPAPTATSTPNTAPAAPKSFSATSGTNYINLKWTAVSNVTGYEIYRKTNYNGSFSKIKTISSASVTSFKNTGLAKNREYYYKIRAYTKADSKTYKSSYSTLTAATFSTGQAAVTSAKLTLLSKPSNSAAKLKTIPKKSTFVYLGRTFLKNGKKFLHVNYIVSSKSYTGYLPASTSLKYYKLGYTTANLNLRKAPGTDQQLLTQIPNGTPVAILGTKKLNGTNWYKTRYLSGNKLYTGYVSSSYIR